VGPDPVQIQVTAFSDSGGRLPADGTEKRPPAATVVLDVTEIFSGTRPAEMEIRADHPWYVPAVARLSVPGSDVVGADGTVEYRTAVPMRRAAAASGRVLDERGNPLRGVPVSLHRLLRDGPEDAAAEVAQSAADGSFRLRAGASGDVVVVAAMASLRPAARTVVATVGTDVPVGDLVVQRGAEISGQVSLAGIPLPARVSAAAEPLPARGLQVGASDVAWVDGRPEHRRIDVETDAEGRYRVSGLREGHYRVSVKNVRGLTMHESATRDLARVARAPATDVNFQVNGARLRLEIGGEKPPSGAAAVTLMGGGGVLGVSTDVPGTLTILVGAGSRFQVHVFAEGCEGDERDVLAPAVGEERTERVTLRLKRGKGTVLVTLKTAGDSPARAGFGLFPEGSTFPFPSVQKDVEGEAGRFRLTDLEPGSYRLVTRAGGTWYGGQGYYLEASASVEIPATGETSATLTLNLGGRMRIAARDEDGKLLSADCTIRDEKGALMEASFLVRTHDGWAVTTGATDADAPSLVDPPMPVGTYEVRCSREGFSARAVSVKVEAGATADVNVVLSRQ